MLCHTEQRFEIQLTKPPVRNVPDVLFDTFWRHTVDRSHLECEINERIFQLDRILTDFVNAVA